MHFFQNKAPKMQNSQKINEFRIWEYLFMYLINLPTVLILFARTNSPGILAGEMGPDLDWLLPTGEPTGEGDGPPGMPERCGEAWGENGDCAGLLCSPWLLVEPDALTAELRVASVPVGKSSMDPDKSWGKRKNEHKCLHEYSGHRTQELAWQWIRLFTYCSRQLRGCL